MSDSVEPPLLISILAAMCNESLAGELRCREAVLELGRPSGYTPCTENGLVAFFQGSNEAAIAYKLKKRVNSTVDYVAVHRWPRLSGE